MSYSFTVRRATKVLALEAVLEGLQAVADKQLVHAQDIPAAKLAAQAYIGLLQDPPLGHEVVVECHGSCQEGATKENEGYSFLSHTCKAFTILTGRA